MSLPLPPGQTPRGWQLEAIEAAKVGLATYQSGIISAATGTGKGSLIAGLAVLAGLKGNRVLLLAHRDELVEELVTRIRRVPGAPPVGLVKAERDEWLCPIVVASVQSVTARRRPRMGVFSLVLTDECHHATAPGYGRVYDAVCEGNPDWKHLGFTATPFRSGKDGMTSGLGSVFDAVLFEYGIADAIGNGDLVPLRAYQVSTDVDLSSVRTGIDGDFAQDDLADAVDTPERNQVVVAEYQRRGAGRPALAFAASIAHAQHIAEAFRAAGIPSEAVWGDMEKDKRRGLIATFRKADGTLPVLCSKDLIFEGFDAPATELVLKARPTKSRVVFTQMVGRGLRLSPGTGKTECIFVDLVDNGCELDLVTAQDLTDEGTGQPKASHELQPGDRVERRHHRDWGVGVITDIQPGALVHARVRWPPSAVHRHGIVLVHTGAELKFVPPEAKDDEVEQLVLFPRVVGVRSYEVFLLPGQGRRAPVGWYEHNQTWSASGELPDRGRIALLTRSSGRGYEVWERRTAAPGPGEPAPDQVTRIHQTADGSSLEIALAWCEEHLRALRVRVSQLDVEWKGQLATDGQQRSLRSWGVRRDLAGMSRGEASALLDAVVMLRRIADVQNPAAARRAAMWRQRYAGKGQRASGAA